MKKKRVKVYLEIPITVVGEDLPGCPIFKIGFSDNPDGVDTTFGGSVIFTDGERITSTKGPFVSHVNGWNWEAFLVWARAKKITVFD